MNSAGDDPPPSEDAQRLEQDIEGIRENLDGLMRELDHRRHDLFDWRGQLRRHARPFGLGVFALVVLVGGGVAIHLYRKRKRAMFPARMRRLKMALERMVDHPERVAVPASHDAPMKIATALATTALSVFLRSAGKS